MFEIFIKPVCWSIQIVPAGGNKGAGGFGWGFKVLPYVLTLTSGRGPKGSLLTGSSDAANKTIAPQLSANLPFCVTLDYDSRNLNLNACG